MAYELRNIGESLAAAQRKVSHNFGRVHDVRDGSATKSFSLLSPLCKFWTGFVPDSRIFAEKAILCSRTDLPDEEKRLLSRAIIRKVSRSCARAHVYL